MDIQEHFLERLPRKPYCTNVPQDGMIIRSKHIAIKHRHIQPNKPMEISWLLFDLDFAGAAFAWEKANLPAPTITVVNPANAHAHLFYGLNTPVVTSPAAHEKPIRYVKAIRAAMEIKLDADPGYVGLIAKNPLHADWRTLWINKCYDLGDLAEYVTLPRILPARDLDACGRNSSLFEQLRMMAYPLVRAFKEEGRSWEQWFEFLLTKAEALNNKFSEPLPFSSIKSTAKSVAKGTWRYCSTAEFSKKQSARGRRGGRPATTTKNGAPWEPLGISRATYYRKRKAGQLEAVPA